MGKSHSHHYHTETIVKPCPKTEQKLKETEEKVNKLVEEATIQKDPKMFAENSTILFDNFVGNIKELSLTDSFEKETGVIDVAFIGPVTAGKTTCINVMFKLNEETALGHCTKECRRVYKKDLLAVWDVQGVNNDFKFYDYESLAFIKSTDKNVVMFDNDISMVSRIIKTVYNINPESLLIVRTKVDQCSESDKRTIEQEKLLDTQKVEELLGVKLATYCISSHNVIDEKKKYDWDLLKQKIGLTEI
jgi:hypothetical protein